MAKSGRSPCGPGLAVLMALILVFASPAFSSVCGDINGNGQIDILDATFLINFLYRGGQTPPDLRTADVDGSGSLNILDISYLVNWLYNGGPGPQCGNLDQQDISGECLAMKSSGDDYMILEVIGNDLHIHHMNVFYNCCLLYAVDYQFEGYDITAVESDTGEPCDCICPFDLETILYDLLNGNYTITLIDINGDTAGAESFTIGTGQEIIYQDMGGCYQPEDPAKVLPITYTYNGNTLTLNHYMSSFNCGANIIFQFEKAGDTLRFYEINISHDLVYCMCYFDLTVSVEGIESGTYVAEIYDKQYYYLEDFQLVDRQVIDLDE